MKTKLMFLALFTLTLSAFGSEPVPNLIFSPDARYDIGQPTRDRPGNVWAATSFNNVAITPPATLATLVLGSGKTITLNDTFTIGTDSITFGGTEVLTLAPTKNVTFADAFITSGAFSLTLTTTATTNVTLPTTGTLATRAGSESLTNKTITDFINGGTKVSTSQLDAVTGTTGTTLTNIPGLTVNVTAAGTYVFRAYLSGVSTANGGVKFAIGGTATATSFRATGFNYNTTTINAVSTTTTLGSAVGAATAVYSNGLIEGMIVVANAGTLTVQMAQNVAHADTTSVFANSSFLVSRSN
jgi:hypothetical protein